MSVPPLHQSVLNPGVYGVTFEKRYGDLQGINNVKQRNSEDRCNVKPDCNINMLLAAFCNCSEKIYRKYNPNYSDENVNWPLELRVLLRSSGMAPNIVYRSATIHRLHIPIVNMSVSIRGSVVITPEGVIEI